MAQPGDEITFIRLPEDEKHPDYFKILVKNCIRVYAKTFSDTVALDANGIIDEQRMLVLSDPTYQRETKQLKARRALDNLSEINRIRRLVETDEDDEDDVVEDTENITPLVHEDEFNDFEDDPEGEEEDDGEEKIDQVLVDLGKELEEIEARDDNYDAFAAHDIRDPSKAAKAKTEHERFVASKNRKIKELTQKMSDRSEFLEREAEKRCEAKERRREAKEARARRERERVERQRAKDQREIDRIANGEKKQRKRFDKTQIDMLMKTFTMQQDMLNSLAESEGNERESLNLVFIAVNREEFEKLQNVEVSSGTSASGAAYAGDEDAEKKKVASGIKKDDPNEVNNKLFRTEIDPETGEPVLVEARS